MSVGPSRTLLFVVVMSAAIQAACGRSGSSPGTARAAAPAGGDTTVAEVAGSPIRLSDVDQRAAGRLQRLKDDEYEVRRAALEAIISERLLEKEAARRGLSRDALVQREVGDKVAAPAEAEVRSVYEGARGRLGGLTLDQVRPQIEASLREQRQVERQQAFEGELRRAAGVTVKLEQPRTAVPVPADAPSMGAASAPVTVVEFLDYQCPYCHRVQPLLDELMARYPGKLRFVQREFLIDKPRSLAAARAARCAAEQGRFWEYHRDLLSTPGDMSDDDLRRRASTVGLDAARFGTCATSDRYDQAIREASRQGHELGVTGTPTFFINGRRLSGVRPLEQYTEAIDAELAGRS